ncbi:MAG TPA: immunoglobulin domain-containing protein, partial [Opitutaceae bacterium]|nr:immunoglobulin domain-containing protein [Opitutaceae bacterium]
ATITAQPPEAIAAQAGERVVLAVSASSDLPVTYQWKRDGINIPGATAATLTLDAAAAGDAGTYTVAITNANGTILSRAVTLTVALPTSRIANLSVRTEAGTGAQMLIVGIALGGPNTSGNGAILIRGIGPSLSTFDITGYLPDPNIGFYEGSTVVATNDNWGGTTALGTLFTQVGAFPLTGPTSLDAALALTPRGGTYTVQVAGAAGTTGNALVEIYDASTGASAPRLVNVSARAQVGGAGGSLIAGFVITGSGAKTVLIRAIGPTLGAFGVPGTLADPRVELLKSGVTAPFASNDNWSGTAAMAETFRQVGAFQLAAGTRDAAILVTLEAGAYTAQVTSGDASAGVALVEVYEVP